MLPNDLPTLGVCLPISALPEHLDFILADQRDLEIQDAFDAALLNGDWRTRAATARELLQDHRGRVGVHGPFWGFTIDSRDPDVQAVVAKRMDQALDFADAVGANQIVIHSPYRTWDAQNLDMGLGGRETLIACVQETLGAALKRAEALGITFVIENIEDIDPADRRTLAAALGSPAVKLSIDTGHAHYAHTTNGAPPVDYFVRDAGTLLEHVHIQDADGYADRHWAPGWGTVNWRAVFAAIAEVRAAGGQPRLNLELRDKSQIPAAAAYLAGLGLAR